MIAIQPPSDESPVTLADGTRLHPLRSQAVKHADMCARVAPQTPRALLTQVWVAAFWASGVRAELMVIVTIDVTQKHGPLLHVSLSHTDHLPDWRTIRLVKDAFFGKDRDAMIALPREEIYVNLHNFCFHLWQMPERWEIM